MKKFLSLLTILLFSLIVAKGQNLTLDQLILLNTKSLAEVEEFLTAKNWEFIKATEPSDGMLGSVTFAYQKHNYDDKASSFLTYYYSKYSKSSTRTNIQINTTTIYNTFLSRLKSLGYKLASSNVEGGDIKKIYKGKSYVIEVTTGAQEEDFATKTTYHFFVQRILDYNGMRSNYISPEINDIPILIDSVLMPVDTVAAFYAPTVKQEADEAYESNEFKKAIRLYLILINSGDIDSDDFLKVGYSYLGYNTILASYDILHYYYLTVLLLVNNELPY